MRGDGRLVFALRHDQRRAPGGFAGYRYYTVDGKRQPPESLAAETYEYRFTAIDAATGSAVNGSSAVSVQPSTAYLPQPGSTGSAACTWQFGVGAAAPAPPPQLQAQVTPTPPAPGAAPSPAPNLNAAAPSVPSAPGRAFRGGEVAPCARGDGRGGGLAGGPGLGFDSVLLPSLSFTLRSNPAGHFLVDGFSRAACDDLRSGMIRTIDDPMSADSQAPVSLQFSLKGFPGVWIRQDVMQSFPHFPFQLWMKMADKVPK